MKEKISCIYLIEIKDHSYIGSTKDFDARYRRHLNTLNSNTHHNINMQRAFNKYGEASFSMMIIEECSAEELFDREKFFIDQLKPTMNIGSVGGGDNLTNNPRREEIIAKITASIKKRYAEMSPEEIHRRYARFGSDNPNWRGGPKICPICNKNPIAKYNKSCLPCRDISGDKNPFYGKTHSVAVKAKLSAKGKERAKTKVAGNARAVFAEGLLFDSLAQCARYYGLSGPAAIAARIKRDSYPEFRYASEEDIQNTPKYEKFRSK